MEQAGAELGQAQVKLDDIVVFVVEESNGYYYSQWVGGDGLVDGQIKQN